MGDILVSLKNAVTFGEEEIEKLVREALDSGLTPRLVLEEAMMPAMEDVGEKRFSRSEAFIPELIVAASSMEKGMEVLKPFLSGGEKGRGLVVLGAVHGDIHSIGKNLVRMCVEGASYRVVDIGEDVRTELFAEPYCKYRPDIQGLSALLSSTMQRMPEVIRAVRAEDPSAVIMVGGTPVTQDFADRVGTSGYTPNALEAVVKARELLRQSDSAARDQAAA